MDAGQENPVETEAPVEAEAPGLPVTEKDGPENADGAGVPEEGNEPETGDSAEQKEVAEPEVDDADASEESGEPGADDSAEQKEDAEPESAAADASEETGDPTTGGSAEQKDADDPETGSTEPEDDTEPEDADREELLPEPAAAGTVIRPKKRSRKHRKKNWLLRLLITAGVLAAFFAVANLSYFEITEIPVIGNQTVSDKKIVKLSQIRKGDSIFFLNNWLIKSRVKKNLYIETVKIHRVFPGTVEIIVTEREGAAQFIRIKENGKRRYIVIDRDGMVMSKSKKRKNVTIVDNVHVTEAEKGSRIKVDDSGTYNKAMELIAAAEEGDLYFRRIYIRGSLVKAWFYDDLKCKGRFSNMMSSIRSGELKTVVYRLYQEDISKGTINIGDNNYCSFTP